MQENEPEDGVVYIKHHTKKGEKKQDIFEYIREKFPHDIEESAKACGVIVRKRKLQSAYGLLQMIIAYVTLGWSQRLLAARAISAGIAHMSDQAWQKKFIKCEEWLMHLIRQTLPQSKELGKHFKCLTKRVVKLIDASIFAVQGESGTQLRLHTCYDLIRGCMDELLLTDHHTAESVLLFQIEQGAIYLADAGYGLAKQIEYMVKRGADALFRMSPNHVALAEDAQGKKKIDMKEVLKNARGGMIDFPCFARVEKHNYIQVRIVASRKPKDQIAKSHARAQRKAKKQQAAIKEETLLYAEWMILMTTLGDDYSTAQLLHLYRARFFSIEKLRNATLAHSKILVLTYLLIFSFVERDVIAYEIFLHENNESMERYSPWMLGRFALDFFLAKLQAFWCHTFFPCDVLLHSLQRLRSHKSYRPNQYASFRFPSSA